MGGRGIEKHIQQNLVNFKFKGPKKGFLNYEEPV
jgi:hypothetical protein